MEKDGQKLIAMIKKKVESYTKYLRRIDAILDRLGEERRQTLKEGDECSMHYILSGMPAGDVINTENIQRIRAKLGDLNDRGKEYAERQEKLIAKVDQAQHTVDLSQSNLERTVRQLFEDHGLLEDVASSDANTIISTPHCSPPRHYHPLPRMTKSPSPSPTELERRTTQDLYWDLFKIQTLEGKLATWRNYESVRLGNFLQALDEDETSETQTVFDLKMLEEFQATTRELIKAEEEYARTQERARKLGMLADDGEEDEGFSDFDDDGHTASHEEMDYGELVWWGINQWIEKTPESGAEPDVVGVAKVETDEWDAGVVEIEDSISVREDYKAVGRRRKKIDEYRRICEAFEMTECSN